MGNTRALSWLKFGHARHGDAAMIQVGGSLWIAVRRLRISPFFLRPGRNSPNDFLTRTTEPQLQDWAETQEMRRILLGRKWVRFDGVATLLRRYRPGSSPSPTVYYESLKNMGAVFVEFNHRSFSLCHFAREMGLGSNGAILPIATSGIWLRMHAVSNTPADRCYF